MCLHIHQLNNRLATEKVELLFGVATSVALLFATVTMISVCVCVCVCSFSLCLGEKK
jgi:hypothetical protein